MFGILIGVIIGAAMLGGIIMVMERDGFPGWDKMIPCVLAAVIPASIVNYLLPPSLFPIGLAVGAICAGFAISFTCGMGVKRACIAAGIYLAIQVAIGFTLIAAIG